MPQLVELPSILAHTIYQTLEFDNALAGRVYVPRGAERWYGLSEVILGRPEWFNRWLNAEKDCASSVTPRLPLLTRWTLHRCTVFDGKYYAAISASDAWQIVPEEDYDATEAQTSVRPTNAALSVADLAEQITCEFVLAPCSESSPDLSSQPATNRCLSSISSRSCSPCICRSCRRMLSAYRRHLTLSRPCRLAVSCPARWLMALARELALAALLASCVCFAQV